MKILIASLTTLLFLSPAFSQDYEPYSTTRPGYENGGPMGSGGQRWETHPRGENLSREISRESDVRSNWRSLT